MKKLSLNQWVMLILVLVNLLIFYDNRESGETFQDFISRMSFHFMIYYLGKIV